MRRNQHGAAGVLAVIKSQKQAASLVPLQVVIATHLESAPIQLQHLNHNAQQISKVSEWFEDAVGDRADIRGESQAKEVERINRPGGVSQAQQIHASLAPGLQCL